MWRFSKTDNGIVTAQQMGLPISGTMNGHRLLGDVRSGIKWRQNVLSSVKSLMFWVAFLSKSARVIFKVGFRRKQSAQAVSCGPAVSALNHVFVDKIGYVVGMFRDGLSVAKFGILSIDHVVELLDVMGQHDVPGANLTNQDSLIKLKSSHLGCQGVRVSVLWQDLLLKLREHLIVSSSLAGGRSGRGIGFVTFGQGGPMCITLVRRMRFVPVTSVTWAALCSWIA